MHAPHGIQTEPNGGFLLVHLVKIVFIYHVLYGRCHRVVNKGSLCRRPLSCDSCVLAYIAPCVCAFVAPRVWHSLPVFIVLRRVVL